MDEEASKMCEHRRKSDALDATGFVFDYYHGTYVNPKLKAIISYQYLDSLTAAEAESWLPKIGPSDEWQFFCLKPPHPAARKELELAYS
jgi:hypothetical protein